MNPTIIKNGSKLSTLEEFKAAIAEERRQDRRHAKAFVAACVSGDRLSFDRAISMLHDWSIDGWRIAIRAIARHAPAVSEDIKRAFLAEWIETKSIQRSVGDDKATLSALRVLLPAYTGPPMRLFRGDNLVNRRRRTYGIAWSAKRATAERFAQEPYNLASKGGAVLLKTLAPASSIICATHVIGDHYGEDEYLVDRRVLGPVEIVARYPQIFPEELSQFRHEPG